jgi:YD repeat-containing protein
MSCFTRRLTVVLLSMCVGASLLRAQGTPVTYVYDELDRLVGVIDATGAAAVYTYDAVGNLLSITRQAAGTVSIIEFTPDAGPSGTAVTIFGIGFSTTPSLNTLTFNGTTATVLTATATRLTTTVPGGATTGAMSVTTPSGSATSAGVYTVAATNVPTISSFSPLIATAGTSLSLTGTNFTTTPANNRLKVNLQPTYALSGTTSTSLATTVPTGTSSGRVTESTPGGTVVSAADLFIPPDPYTATDVEYTDRMSYGDSRSVTINTSGKIGLEVFDGALNQRTSIEAVPGPSSVVTLYKPDGTILTTRSAGYFPVLLEPGNLPMAGTYTLNVDPVLTATGTVTVTLYNVPADLTGTFTPSNAGDAKTLTITTPGQNARDTFSGTSGHRLSLSVSSGPNGTVSILNPDSSTLMSTTMGIFQAFVEPVTLGATGTYTVITDPLEEKTGSVTVTLYDVPADTTGTVTLNGSAVAVPLSTPGQQGSLTFSGTSSQLVTVNMTGNTFGLVYITLLKPDGSVLATTSSSYYTNLSMAQQTLPTTGTYTIVVTPNQTSTGTISVAVTNP